MSATPESRPVLGFDYGLRRIGVAVGQGLTGTAQPLQVISNRHGQVDWPPIDRLVAEWQPQSLVVGVPLTEDGAEQPMTVAARGFLQQLSRRYGLPVHGAEERFSSREASTRFREARAGGHARRRDAGLLDAQAARLILEDWLAAHA